MSDSAAPPHEVHTLEGSPTTKVVVWADGSVDITFDDVVMLDPEQLGRIVAFVEHHGQVTVIERD